MTPKREELQWKIMPLSGWGQKQGWGVERQRTQPDALVVAVAAALQHPGQRPRRVQFSAQRRCKPEPLRSEDGAPAQGLPAAPPPWRCPVTCRTEKSIPLHFRFHLEQGRQTAFPFLNFVLIFPCRLWKCSLGLERVRSLPLHLCR